MSARHKLIFAGILALAAFFRLWRLGEMPPGFYHDEAYNGLDALALLEGAQFPLFHEAWELYANDAHAESPIQPTRIPVFFEGNYGREPLHIYLMALSIKLFGATPFALRLVPALAGILAAAMMVWLGHEFLPDREKSPTFPLAAAFFLAIFVPTIHFSRFGLRVMLFLPLQIGAAASYWRGRKKEGGGWAWFALAGILIGGALYSYAAARLFPMLFLWYGGWRLWRDSAQRRRELSILGIVGAFALAIAAPLLFFFWRLPYFFLFRIATVANKGTGVTDNPGLTWLLNAGRVLRGLFWQGESHLRHNLPGRPFLDGIQSLFVVAGILAWFRRRQPRHIFLGFWLALMIAPSIFSGDAPHFGRMAGAAPPLALWAGMGFTMVWNYFQSRQYAVAGKGLALLLALCSAGISGYDYFVRYGEHPQLAADFYLPDWRLGQAAAATAPETTLYFSPPQEEMATIFFALNDRRADLHSFNGNLSALPAGIPGQPAAYFIRPADSQTLAKLDEYFPDGELKEAEDYALFELPADSPGITTSVAHFGGEIHLLACQISQNAQEIQTKLWWQAATQPNQAYTAFVHATDHTGAVAAQVDRQPGGYPTSDWAAGEIVIDTLTMPAPQTEIMTISTGFYELATLERLGEATLLRHPNGGTLCDPPYLWDEIEFFVE